MYDSLYDGEEEEDFDGEEEEEDYGASGYTGSDGYNSSRYGSSARSGRGDSRSYRTGDSQSQQYDDSYYGDSYYDEDDDYYDDDSGDFTPSDEGAASDITMSSDYDPDYEMERRWVMIQNILEHKDRNRI